MENIFVAIGSLLVIQTWVITQLFVSKLQQVVLILCAWLHFYEMIFDQLLPLFVSEKNKHDFILFVSHFAVQLNIHSGPERARFYMSVSLIVCARVCNHLSFEFSPHLCDKFPAAYFSDVLGRDFYREMVLYHYYSGGDPSLCSKSFDYSHRSKCTD